MRRRRRSVNGNTNKKNTNVFNHSVLFSHVEQRRSVHRPAVVHIVMSNTHPIKDVGLFFKAEWFRLTHCLMSVICWCRSDQGLKCKLIARFNGWPIMQTSPKLPPKLPRGFPVFQRMAWFLFIFLHSCVHVVFSTSDSSTTSVGALVVYQHHGQR